MKHPTKITADTNVLLRAIVGDHVEQAAKAQAVLSNANIVVIPVPVLCEFVWVLRRGYRYSSEDVVKALESLTSSASVVTDRLALSAGLVFLRAGGDFADGAIACIGRALGGEIFVSFDRVAADLAEKAGFASQALD